MDALHRLYDRFSDGVAFYVVYIKEAHPEDGWVVTHNREEEISVLDPRSDEERVETADVCMVRTAIRMPMLIDGIDNATASAYGAWPDRLYLIGADGNIAFQGDPGPFGFIPERLQTAIENELGLA